MQTFVPYPDLRASCAVLDDRRLGKQRVETFQILRALTWPAYAWKSHPAVTMWRGFVPALVAYGLASCDEWTSRGYADTVADQLLAWGPGSADELPPWFGVEAVHLSHRSALVRKDPAYYGPLFPDVPDDLPYYWPTPVFPRWPVRRAAGPVELAEALSLLGFSDPWPGQAAAVDAVAAGRDVLLTVRPGTGGSTAGLLAGLCTDGRTLWVAPPVGPLAGPVPPELLAPTPSPPPSPPPSLPASVVDPRAVSVSSEPRNARTASSINTNPLVARGAERESMSAAVAADVGAERESMSAGEPAPVATSRQPGPADQLAMLAEQSPTGWIFRRPGQTAPGSFGLVVLDRAREVEQWSRPVAAPVLTIVGRASADERQQLTQRLGLRDPLVIGGGWDVPDTWLGVGRVASRGSRIEAVREAIARHGSAVVVTSSRDRAARLALSLTGLRTALWAPTKRPGPAIGAIGAWRSGRLDALVIPAGELPSVGRKRVPLLLHADAPESTDSWRDVVAAVGPAAAVLLLGPDAPADVAGLLDGCVRAGLLEQYGELLEAPCGRCSNED